MMACLLKFPFLLLFSAAAAVATTNASESVDCPSADILSGKLITDVCWDCIFPLVIGGVPLGGSTSDRPDAAAPGRPVCVCFDDAGVAEVGTTFGMWEPAKLIEFTDTPGCSSVLGGVKFPFDQTNRGTTGRHQSVANGEPKESYHHYHYYAFPLLNMLDLFTGRGCSSDGYSDLDIVFMSELDPTWNRDELAFFSTPEAVMVANPIALAACAADAASATAGKPLDNMFWCAGSWGGMYPLSGTQTEHPGIIGQTSLGKAKLLAALHRRGMMRRSMGEEALCGPQIDPFMPKSQYKFTTLYPVAETNRAHAMGESTLRWGAGRTIPAVAEYPIYTTWQWNDCCVR